MIVIASCTLRILSYLQANIIPMQGGVPIVRTLTAPPNTPAHLKFERKYMAGADKHTFHTGTHNMDFNRYYSNHSPSADIDNNKKDMSKYSLICQQFNNIGGSKHLHTVGMKSSSGEYAERAINPGVVALYGQENLFLATSHPLQKDDVGTDEDDGIVFRFLTNFPVTNIMPVSVPSTKAASSIEVNRTLLH
jgi:hypothetical protein